MGFSIGSEKVMWGEKGRNPSETSIFVTYIL